MLCEVFFLNRVMAESDAALARRLQEEELAAARREAALRHQQAAASYPAVQGNVQPSAPPQSYVQAQQPLVSNGVAPALPPGARYVTADGRVMQAPGAPPPPQQAMGNYYAAPAYDTGMGICPNTGRQHDVVVVWPTCLGVLCGVLCFPVGCICCACDREYSCKTCGMPLQRARMF
mmetsp:Transcript_75052/g.172021  ORF Transcript_75052/g.172021 Transcript_75052/m.172021 type:complete len:176 (-) Transcript_75052:246-773(-)